MVSPLKEIISEKDFLEIFQKQTSEIMKICAYLNEKNNEDFLFTKRFYGNITTQARILEDFLDDYGAKNNRTWVYFRELVASARYMGYCSSMIQHVRNRYALYDVQNIKEKEFLEKTARRFPDKTGIIFPGVLGDSYRITFQQLKQDVNRLANALISLGVKKGDRVTLLMPNCS